MSGFIDAARLNNISIVYFLSQLGHNPVYLSGKEHFYHSMLRETGGNTPSMTVWDKGGKWHDLGGGSANGISGGGIVQLGLALWPELSYVEVLGKICEVARDYDPLVDAPLEFANGRAAQKQVQSGFTLIRTEPLGTNPILDRYLTVRCLHNVAEGFLKEVYYSKSDGSDIRERFALGWQNQSGNWEFANVNGFKSSIGPKDISVIEGDQRRTVIFEGYMDFLSWLEMENVQPRPTVIVLNSVALLPRAVDKLANAGEVYAYFDNDNAGRECFSKLIAKVPWARDVSMAYHGYKDYNEKLVAENNRISGLNLSLQNGRGR